MNKRVVFVSELYYPENNATGYYLTGDVCRSVIIDRYTPEYQQEIFNSMMTYVHMNINP